MTARKRKNERRHCSTLAFDVNQFSHDISGYRGAKDTIAGKDVLWSRKTKFMSKQKSISNHTADMAAVACSPRLRDALQKLDYLWR